MRPASKDHVIGPDPSLRRRTDRDATKQGMQKLKQKFNGLGNQPKYRIKYLRPEYLM